MLNDVIQIPLVARQSWTKRDVVVDGFRKGIRFLENHADSLSNFDWIDTRIVKIDAVIQDLPIDPSRFNKVVHAVKATKHCRLSAARRTNKRCDFVLENLKIDIAHCSKLAVVDVEFTNVEHHRGCFWHGNRCRCNNFGVWCSNFRRHRGVLCIGVVGFSHV